jgi:hypothetical protein
MQTVQAELDRHTSTNSWSTEKFESVYRQYVVRYRPQPTPDGRFLAYVIILRRFARMHTEASVMPDLPSFESQADAAGVGLQAGRCWIDQNGV